MSRSSVNDRLILSTFFYSTEVGPVQYKRGLKVVFYVSFVNW